MTRSAPPAVGEPTQRSGVLQVLAGSVAISFSPVLVKVAHVGPTMIGFYRTFIGGAILLGLVLIRREPLWRGSRPLFWALVAGLFFGADLSLWHRSIVYVGPGLATILANFQVFFLSAIGILIFRETLTLRLVLAIPLAVSGLVLLVGLDWTGLATSYRWGVLLGLATAVAYTGYVLALRKAQKLSTRLGPMANLAVVSGITAPLLLAEGLAQGETLAVPDPQSWAALLAYGAVCQALGWILISRGLATVGASRVGLLLLLQPSLAFVWDILFFGRPTAPMEAVGAVIALAAIYLGSVPGGVRFSRRTA